MNAFHALSLALRRSGSVSLGR